MRDDDRDNDIESDGDKRAHHNALERKRRGHIKDSFTMLRDCLPFFQGNKVQASKAQILKKTADYIQTMRRKNTAHQQDIKKLKKQTRHLEDQISLFKKLESEGRYTEALGLAQRVFCSSTIESNGVESEIGSSEVGRIEVEDEEVEEEESAYFNQP